MAMASPQAQAAGHAESWPLKLQQRQKLRLGRGDVFVIDQWRYAVVSYDGRNEGYGCWIDRGHGRFDTTQQAFIDRQRAHNSQLDLQARSVLPPLPPVDHTGRIVVAGEARNLRSAATSAGTPDTTVPCTPLARTPPEPPAAAGFAATMLRGVSSGGGSVDEEHWEQAIDGRLAGDAQSSSPLGELQPRKCVLVTVFKAMKECLCQGLVSIQAAIRAAREAKPTPRARPDAEEWLLHPDGSWHRAQRSRSLALAPVTPQRQPPAPPVQLVQSPQCTAPVLPLMMEADGHRSPQIRGAASASTFDDLQITIPIVKPPMWQEVQHLVHQMPVTFDERGVKETMTVRSGRWEAFVDRQKAKIQKEIDEHKRFNAAQAAAERGVQENMTVKADRWQGFIDRRKAKLQREIDEHKEMDQEEEEEEIELVEAQDDAAVDQPAQTFEEQRRMSGDDIAEMEQLVERMDDWKDLARYSGKSISMASIRRGNEMKIHVMAFAERDDGTGVDFVRVAYKKSVEVRENCKPARAVQNSGILSRLITPFLRGPIDNCEERLVQLLQQPDVAKFTIAVAFRGALANDGVHLQFCESRLDDMGVLSQDPSVPIRV